MKKNALLLWYLLFFFFCSSIPSLKADENDLSQHVHPLAKECSSVIEIGADAMFSILQGLSENPAQQRTYLGIDLTAPPKDTLNSAQEFSVNKGIHFTFWPIDHTHIFIEPTDLLFIDSLRSFDHLASSLDTFSPQVKKYICLFMPNPTTEAHGQLKLLVLDFLQKHPEWLMCETFDQNPCFTVLKRMDETAAPASFSDPLVDHYLKEKIILCTGPALGRYQMLKETTEGDLALIPFKKIFVTTNERKILDISFHGNKPAVCKLIPNRGKHLDCINCIVSTIKNAVNDPEVDDNDIILFKHESVMINDMGLIKKAIHKMVNEGYDMVVRNMAQWNGITATDAFFIKVSAIREWIQNFSEVTGLPPDGWFCECYFHNYIVKHIPKVYGIYYNHSNGDFTELGFYHIPSIPEAGRPFWDRKNYQELFFQPSFLEMEIKT